MNKSLLLAITFGAVGVASAEDAPDATAPGDTIDPAAVVVQGAGVKVGEGTVVHPTVGVETGVVSNVFYEESGRENVAGLLRVLIELSTGSLPAERLAIHNEAATDPGEQSREIGMLQYLASVYASWDQFLSTNDAVQEQGGLGGGLVFKGIANPQKTLSVSFLEHFDRAIRAANFETGEDVNRDVNLLALRFNILPRGRNLGGYFYYRNLVDYFEDNDQQFANRFQNTFGAHLTYQWLPLTRFYADASLGAFTGLGDSTKTNSYPLRVLAGIQTALSLNLTVNGRIGYTQGFYSAGSDYATITGGVQVGYRYSPRGRALLMYDYDHQDSINANFYRDHMIKLQIDQQFVPFVVQASGEVHLRRYESTLVMDVGGGTTRDDVIGAVNLTASYMFRGWIAGVLSYEFAAVSTDFLYDAGGGFIDDPSYARHLLLAGVRAAY